MSVEHKMKLTGGGRAGFGCSVSLLFYIRFGRCCLYSICFVFSYRSLIIHDSKHLLDLRQFNSSV